MGVVRSQSGSLSLDDEDDPDALPPLDSPSRLIRISHPRGDSITIGFLEDDGAAGWYEVHPDASYPLGRPPLEDEDVAIDVAKAILRERVAGQIDRLRQYRPPETDDSREPPPNVIGLWDDMEDELAAVWNDAAYRRGSTFRTEMQPAIFVSVRESLKMSQRELGGKMAEAIGGHPATVRQRIRRYEAGEVTLSVRDLDAAETIFTEAIRTRAEDAPLTVEVLTAG